MKRNKQLLFVFLSGILMAVTSALYYVLPDAVDGRWNWMFGIWCAGVWGLLSVVGYFLCRGEGKSARRGRIGAQIDDLTGLPNRNYFKEAFGEQSIFNTLRYKSIAVFDVDKFKEANDTIDGDAVLRFVSDCARRTFGEQGEVFRWGGDEFMVLMEWSMEFAYEICREFCREVEKGGQVTVSVGLTEVRLSDTIKRNYYRAVQGCYLVKEVGGNGVKRN